MSGNQIVVMISDDPEAAKELWLQDSITYINLLPASKREAIVKAIEQLENKAV